MTDLRRNRETGVKNRETAGKPGSQGNRGLETGVMETGVRPQNPQEEAGAKLGFPSISRVDSPRRAEKPTGAFRRMPPAGFTAPRVGRREAMYRVRLPLIRRYAPA